MYYIYVLKTTACNKVYVGCTTNPERREREHKRVEKRKWKDLTKCGKAVKRYGAHTFSLVVKEECETMDEAVIAEDKWIKRFGPKRLWNSSVKGGYGNRIRKHIVERNET